MAERIWGKPIPVVNAWDAVICTGFYYMRASGATVELAREVRDAVASLAVRQPKRQSSDQLHINDVLNAWGVRWDGGARMPGMDDCQARMFGNVSALGSATSPRGRPLLLQMLAHASVPRACPVEDASGTGASAKARLWPPRGTPCKRLYIRVGARSPRCAM